jgi:hypothetical protein
MRLRDVVTCRWWQVAITVMHLGRWHLQGDAVLVLMALQCILLWLRLQFYLKCALFTLTHPCCSLLLVITAPGEEVTLCSASCALVLCALWGCLLVE